MSQIAVVVPTIRPKSLATFQEAWQELFAKYAVNLIVVEDGKYPKVEGKSVKAVMGDYSDLIFNFNDGVRNLGLAYVAKYLPETEVIITLDDDVEPLGDTIGTHLLVLRQQVPVSWMSTANRFTRGFPYSIRKEAEVVLSHGVWEGIKDYDSPTQLVLGNPETEFYRGPIPKGVYYPMCGMNLAFKKKLLPYMYFAPMGPKAGLDRFADIWAGIFSKIAIDSMGWAVITGYAKVKHNKASNVFQNLIKEAKGIWMNEKVWKVIEEDPHSKQNNEYLKLYSEKRARWEEYIELQMNSWGMAGT